MNEMEPPGSLPRLLVRSSLRGIEKGIPWQGAHHHPRFAPERTQALALADDEDDKDDDDKDDDDKDDETKPLSPPIVCDLLLLPEHHQGEGGDPPSHVVLASLRPPGEAFLALEGLPGWWKRGPVLLGLASCGTVVSKGGPASPGAWRPVEAVPSTFVLGFGDGSMGGKRGGKDTDTGNAIAEIEVEFDLGEALERADEVLAGHHAVSENPSPDARAGENTEQRGERAVPESRARETETTHGPREGKGQTRNPLSSPGAGPPCSKAPGACPLGPLLGGRDRREQLLLLDRLAARTEDETRTANLVLATSGVFVLCLVLLLVWAFAEHHRSGARSEAFLREMQESARASRADLREAFDGLRECWKREREKEDRQRQRQWHRQSHHLDRGTATIMAAPRTGPGHPDGDEKEAPAAPNGDDALAATHPFPDRDPFPSTPPRQTTTTAPSQGGPEAREPPGAAPAPAGEHGFEFSFLGSLPRRKTTFASPAGFGWTTLAQQEGSFSPCLRPSAKSVGKGFASMPKGPRSPSLEPANEQGNQAKRSSPATATTSATATASAASSTTTWASTSATTSPPTVTPLSPCSKLAKEWKEDQDARRHKSHNQNNHHHKDGTRKPRRPILKPPGSRQQSPNSCGGDDDGGRRLFRSAILPRVPPNSKLRDRYKEQEQEQQQQQEQEQEQQQQQQQQQHHHHHQEPEHRSLLLPCPPRIRSVASRDRSAAGGGENPGTDPRPSSPQGNDAGSLECGDAKGGRKPSSNAIDVKTPPSASASASAKTKTPQLCYTPVSEDDSFVDDYW